MGRPIVFPSAELFKLFPFAESYSTFSNQKPLELVLNHKGCHWRKCLLVFQIVHIMLVIQHSKQLPSVGPNSSFTQEAPYKDKDITQRRGKKSL